MAALAALGAAVAPGLAAHRSKPRVTVVLRVTDSDPAGARRTGFAHRALRGHITEVVLSQGRLSEVARRHALAASDLRRRMTVEVIQNQAISLLPPAGRPRSAHVRIGIQDSDVHRAAAIALDLGRVAAATGHDRRRQEIEAALRRAELTAQEARSGLERALADPAQSSGSNAALARAQAREDRAFESLVGARLRHGGVGALEIDLLDPPALPERRPQAAVAVGALTAVLGLPLAALLVGAFDGRVHDARDAAGLGLVLLVSIPRPALGHPDGSA